MAIKFPPNGQSVGKSANGQAAAATEPLYHMLSESNWDRRAVRRQRVVDANAHFGYPGALLLDESAFGKKGNMSAGVARQWNGRLGKVDNCQVGVFAAVTSPWKFFSVRSRRFVP